MRKGSLFTGVGGADIGAEKAGMLPIWYCEIDHSAAGVVAHCLPNTPIYNDITTFKPDRIADAVDVVFGGSPCQDLSVAGKREGLDGSRSRLFFEMVRILKRLRPGCFVWENVPGALSSHGGRDFARVLRAFTGLQIEVPPEGWGNAGFIRTPFPAYRWNVAWRVLDSQYFGVPQRRRRIFLVGSLGNASCTEILFESESVQGNPPPSRSARKGTPASSETGFEGRSDPSSHTGHRVATVASSLTSSAKADRGSERANLIPEVARCLSSSNQRIDAETETFIAMPILDAGARSLSITKDPTAGSGIGEDGDPMFTLRASKQHAVAISTEDFRSSCSSYSIRTTNSGSNGWGIQAETSHTLDSSAGPAINGLLGVRRLTPRECERLQGWPDDHTRLKRCVRRRGNRWVASETLQTQADGPRYRQWGNGVSAPVAEWLSRRIIHYQRKKTSSSTEK